MDWYLGPWPRVCFICSIALFIEVSNIINQIQIDTNLYFYFFTNFTFSNFTFSKFTFLINFTLSSILLSHKFCFPTNIDICPMKISTDTIKNVTITISFVSFAFSVSSALLISTEARILSCWANFWFIRHFFNSWFQPAFYKYFLGLEFIFTGMIF